MPLQPSRSPLMKPSRRQPSNVDKLTELLETHAYSFSYMTCQCQIHTDLKPIYTKDHPTHLAEMLKPLLAEVWYEGMAATKLATLGIRPARNPYETETE